MAEVAAEASTLNHNADNLRGPFVASQDHVAPDRVLPRIHQLSHEESAGTGLPANQCPNTQSAVLPPHLSLRRNLNKWKEIGADPLSLRIIEHGVQLLLKQLPPRCPPRWKKGQEKILTKLLSELEQKGIVPTNWTPIFATPKRERHKWRLITDLRALNKCISTPKFKQEGIKAVLTMLQDGEFHWAAKLDFSDFFHHVGLSKSSAR